MNPVKSVKEFLDNNNISGSILVALSGGADSVCLLSALLECGADVSAFHLNHCIRGEEADRDEEFCRSLCNRLGVPFSSERADIPAISAEKGMGIEEAARNIRYDELKKESIRINADYIATAHNADDNVETVIFNLVRGCSLDGLCGIPKIRGNIIRPLLNSTREEIEDYLCKKGLSYVTDSTNSDITYTRNRIRHSVLPVLRSINPAVSASVARMCESIRDDKAYFESSVAYNDTVLPAELPMSVLTRQISKRFNEKTGLTLKHDRIRDIALRVKARDCVTLDLPGKVCVYIAYGSYNFDKRAENSDYRAKISLGITEIPEINVKIFYGNENVYKLSTSVGLDCDKIVGALYARPRMAGDRITVFGVSKSVRKELINKKIPLYIRNTLPVICDEEGIVYVPYIGAHDRVFSNKGQTLGLLCSETETDNEEQ